MLYVPESVVEALRRRVSLGVFLRMETDPALHLWLGINPIKIGIEAIDPAGTKYFGAGALAGIPDLEMMLNGQADRVDFMLDGLTSEHLEQIQLDAPSVRGARVHMGVAPLDARYQPTSSIIPLWMGTADYRAFQRVPPEEEGGETVHAISVSVGAGDTSRATPKLTSFTDAQQRMISADDRFFDRVVRYVQSFQVSWPRW